jgi:hypothetical protein
MKHEATLIYTQQLIRSAVFAFWRRTVGVGFGVAMAMVAGSLAYLLWAGDRSWVVGVEAAVLLFGVAIALTVYVVHYRNAIAKLRQMPSLQARFVAEQQQFTATSEIGSTTLAWSSVKELWRFESCWLLLFSKAQFMTLPLDCLPAQMQAFMLERLRASGAKIK